MSTSSHAQNFSAYPLAFIAAAFAAGVLVARVTSAPPAPCVVLAAAVSISALFAAVKKKQTAAARLVVLAFACAGASLSSIETKAARAETRLRSFYERGELAAGDPVEVTGVLERAPELAPDGLALSLRLESLRYKETERACSGRVELFAPVEGKRAAVAYDALELRRGARVSVMAALTRAERYRDPGVRPLGEYLEARDVDARGTLKSHLLVERLDDEAVFLPLALLDEWRTRLVQASDAAFSPDASGIFKAAVLGNHYGLSRDTAERFREGGTFHVLVISGLHVAFVGGLVWAATRRFTRRAPAQWALSVAFVWAYAVAVGAEASVVRAALTFTLAALAPALGRRAAPLNATGGAALALLVWRPTSLQDPSFQLTFLSVFAIVAVASPLLSNLKAVGSWRPTRATPYPPACPRVFRLLAEALYWRERVWRQDIALATHSYRLFKNPLAARLERWRVQGALRFVFAAVLVSAVVQVVMLPLLVVYFHRLSLASLLLNVYVGALMVVMSFAALAALALAQLSTTVALPLVSLTEAAAALLAHGVDPFKRAHVASLRLPEYAGAASALYALYFVPLLVLTAELLRWRPLAGPPLMKGEEFEDEGEAEGKRRISSTKRRWLKAAACAWLLTTFVIIVHPFSAGRTGGRLRIDFLDVGQGDAALVTMPDGSTLLVDGGGRPSFRAPRGEEVDAAEFEPDSRGVGEAVVSEYLWWRGLGRVDYVLATHADADHIDGLNAVLKNFEVGAALVGRAPSRDAEFARFAATANEAGVPVFLLARGDRLRFGRFDRFGPFDEVTADVLWPPAANPEAASGNNDSVVLRLSFGRRTFLLTGDIESDAERAVVGAGDALACDALKVAHHGSQTSSTPAFVNAARPALALISVGQDSPYGHPHPSVLARWRGTGARVLTTGQSGAVTVSTDGEDLKVETYVKSP
ncbi:MAG TPA: ComEC/Rec2 family competence protein [Pyrinomonadaceae bacterium]|nr:ComEC/Rec2 family competence protein [Pyrinomonadaceae bacterium]